LLIIARFGCAAPLLPEDAAEIALLRSGTDARLNRLDNGFYKLPRSSLYTPLGLIVESDARYTKKRLF